MQLTLDLVTVANSDRAPADRFPIISIGGSPAAKHLIRLEYIGRRQSQDSKPIALYTMSDASRLKFISRLREAQASNQYIHSWGNPFDAVALDLRTKGKMSGIPSPTWANIMFASPFGKSKSVLSLRIKVC